MHKLSIVIPVYNTAEYLTECLDSIINQTYSNIEIICVDDCTPDNSAEIIKEYAAKDNRIKYIKHSENKKQGAARNTGIDAASGKYITFIDSDDYLSYKYVYEKCISLMEKNNADIITFSFTSFDAENNTEKYTNVLKNLPEKCNVDSKNMREVGVTVWNKIFKLDDIKKVRFPEGMKYEDIPFWYNFVLTIKPVSYNISESFLRYRIHSEQTTQHTKNNIEMPDMFIYLWNILVKHKAEKEYHQNYIDLLNDLLYQYYVSCSEEYKAEYRKKVQELFKIITPVIPDINTKLNMRYYAFFIDDDNIRDEYLKAIEVFEKTKYRPVKPSIFLYKIKREFSRIVSQIQGKKNG